MIGLLFLMDTANSVPNLKNYPIAKIDDKYKQPQNSESPTKIWRLTLLNGVVMVRLGLLVWHIRIQKKNLLWNLINLTHH
jgi:hypothetical protein